MIVATMMKNIAIKLLISCLSFISIHVQANEYISIGVKLLGAGWEGDNGSGGSSFNSDKGGQLGFNVAYKTGNFYTGLSLQGGEYQFTNDAPDQFTTAGRVTASNVNVKQSDFDLLFGYYFWPQASLFIDLKAVGNNWLSDNYEQTFSGMGLGVSAFNPVNEKWTLFGSFGFIGNGEIKDTNENKVGEGTSSAIEIGAAFILDETNQINIGVKFRNYKFEHSDNSKQDYSVNALFVGYTHTFAYK